MRPTQLQLAKFLRKSASRQQENYEKIIRAQKQIERELIRLDIKLQESKELSQKIYDSTRTVVQGALISALFGLCLVLFIDLIEFVFPGLQQNILYLACKTLGFAVFTGIYIYNIRSKK